MLYINPISERSVVGPSTGPESAARAKIAFKELEQFFVYLLMKEMRKTVPNGGLFGESSEREAYEEMLDDAVSRQIAESGQFGLAKMLEEQLRIQELQQSMASEAKPGGYLPFDTNQSVPEMMPFQISGGPRTSLPVDAESKPIPLAVPPVEL